MTTALDETTANETNETTARRRKKLVSLAAIECLRDNGYVVDNANLKMVRELQRVPDPDELAAALNEQATGGLARNALSVVVMAKDITNGVWIFEVDDIVLEGIPCPSTETDTGTKSQRPSLLFKSLDDEMPTLIEPSQ